MPRTPSIGRSMAIVVFSFLLVTVGLMVANPVKADQSGIRVPECAGPGEDEHYPCVITEQGYHILRLSPDGWVII